MVRIRPTYAGALSFPLRCANENVIFRARREENKRKVKLAHLRRAP